ncbi:CDP-diacylglycerol--glycerol-3-phosphate 3-phosphatidyltransferase [Marinicella sp. S1101]|uniref:CDP-diacylglycerol--glycerol-3-phosphate 3-phosphatidyltransferase n=1 Tax=Marinicella marina TaxID=2996016 RepID=UPI002260D54B|nr:CDP-diacylglycerol--glycerol-3-phosphate 3-phosphatidyltransferase [Marinicella marina]MCX7554530.1 CDP-diacylglycerol--glycerol-3-phosphate 3-phosphatidyltransferase [Marinicella marina]MDJ1141086.1 CDP-diacylglycerol--glycerol-3-phosphate 3-phosphatidyltransferase [Marinicella marina]
MIKHLPNTLTLLRVALIPVMILFFYLPFEWSRYVACWVFVLASITDFFDGYFARKYKTESKLGAFLDPVADKLTVATALIILLQDHPTVLMMIATAIIIGREITISALREWMAEVGSRGVVNVAMVGKIKTVFQMTAIGFLLYEADFWFLPVYTIGLVLLYVAAALTLYSMYVYLKAAWPLMKT